MNHEIIGVVAGLISFAAYALYILTTIYFKQKTKPERATWWILTLVGLLIAESYYSSGANTTIWIALSYFIGPLIIALISLKKEYGVGGWGIGFDRWCIVSALVLSVISVGFRLVYSDLPEISLGFNIVIDFIGILPTVMKSYSAPETENKFAWSLTLVASTLSVIAINEWCIEIWIYPIYLTVMNGLILFFLVKERLSRAMNNLRVSFLWLSPGN